jgi:hypothetical protein
MVSGRLASSRVVDRAEGGGALHYRLFGQPVEAVIGARDGVGDAADRVVDVGQPVAVVPCVGDRVAVAVAC